MIKTKIKNICNAREILQKLSEQTLPVATSYSIAKFITAASTELATYDEQRIKLCNRYGKLNEEKTEYVFENPEKKQAFQKEHDELINLEVEINTNPIVLKATDNIKITAQELMMLGAFVEVVGCD